MNLLLVMNLPYEPALGGANKANRVLCERLARRGHTVRVLASALGVPERGTVETLTDDLRMRGHDVRTSAATVRFAMHGVAVRAVTDRTAFRRELQQEIADDPPDCIVVSSEEPSQALFQTALESGRPTVYLLHTLMFLPCGPCALYPSARRTALFSKAARIVAVSAYSADYARRWLGMPADVCYVPVYGEPPFPRLGRFTNRYITLVNPCRYKGLDIFLEVARRMPALEFAAVPGWGTTSADLAALRALPNVSLLPPATNIDRIFEQTRILLAPSLWPENFALIVVEAKLRGVPVVASDVGGLPEAMLATGTVVPVTSLARYTASTDENNLPEAMIEPQDIEPWISAIGRLVNDEATYARESAAEARAAGAFVASLSIDALERALSLAAASGRRATSAPAVGATSPAQI